jgi:transcriptional regulator with XRE-family HTH domain
MTLGSRLKKLREKFNMSQIRVAEKLSISNVQLSRYESDDRKPEPELLAKLADLYETTTDYITGRTDDPSPTSFKGTGFAYYGGGKDLTPEELAIARAAADAAAKAAVEGYRKGKEEKKD